MPARSRDRRLDRPSIDDCRILAVDGAPQIPALPDHRRHARAARQVRQHRHEAVIADAVHRRRQSQHRRLHALIHQRERRRFRRTRIAVGGQQRLGALVGLAVVRRGRERQARGRDQRPVRSAQRLAQRLDGEAVPPAVLGEAGEVVIEGGVDDRVAGGRAGAQSVQIVDGAAMHRGARGGERCRRRVRSRQPQHRMTGAQQFPHHRRPDEARGTRDEDSHGEVLSVSTVAMLVAESLPLKTWPYPGMAANRMSPPALALALSLAPDRASAPSSPDATGIGAVGASDNELGAYLRDRRGRLDPAAFGLPLTRRRTPGLRREEVAQRAHVSATWYTWLEQGRGGAPSEAVLDRLAGALMLTEVEREHLFLLAFGRPPEPRLSSETGVTPRLQRILDALPLSPAIVKTPTWDVVAWNRAAALVLTDYGLLAPEQRNILRLMFCEPRVRMAQDDWESVARFRRRGLPRGRGAGRRFGARAGAGRGALPAQPRLRRHLARARRARIRRRPQAAAPSGRGRVGLRVFGLRRRRPAGPGAGDLSAGDGGG
ncbi:helix-turn-helix domain-containing protein [Ditylenchus destructor]|nr:helix-turn-helix domain-containing protein [Ditylenchus destructor]